jgi:hypothetical protein
MTTWVMIPENDQQRYLNLGAASQILRLPGERFYLVYGGYNADVYQHRDPLGYARILAYLQEQTGQVVEAPEAVGEV